MDSSTLFIYVLMLLISLVFSYFVFRWIFSIERQLKQNKAMIELLGKIAQKNGVSDDEINNIINIR